MTIRLSHLHTHRGFTLMEVLCAILILGVALVGLTQGITLALHSSKESELQTTAALLAAGQIEAMRAEGFITDGTTDGSGGDGLELYRWTQTVSAAGIPGLHKVEVIVENAKTGKMIYQLETQVFERPEDSSPKAKKEKSRQKGSG
jgi:prepilin-type N-terminal cleavage/methylation domain-containing protein